MSNERREVRYREEWNPAVIGFLTPTVIVITSLVLYGGLDIFLVVMGLVVLVIGAVTVLLTERIVYRIGTANRDIVAIFITTVAVALWNITFDIEVGSLLWLTNLAPTVLIGSGIAILLRGLVLKDFPRELVVKLLGLLLVSGTISFLWIVTRIRL